VRSNLENNLAYGLKQWGGQWAGVYATLDGAYTITPDRANVFFFDPDGSNKMVVLPEWANGRYLIIANTGVGGNLDIHDHLGALIVTIEPTFTILLISALSSWQTIGRPGTDSDVPEFGASRTLTGATETITSNERTVLVNREANMTINLPSVASRNGRLLRLIDISVPSPDHTITLVPNGGDTILGGNPNLGLYHNGSDAPVVELWPVAGRWAVK
jgi:hypothetical protein